MEFRAVKYTTEGEAFVVVLEAKKNSLCEALSEEIGNGCRLVERVYQFKISNRHKLPSGYDVVCDEEGWYHGDPVVNPLGSYIYGYPVNGGSLVVGDILIVRNKRNRYGEEDWVSMSEEEANLIRDWANSLKPELISLKLLWEEE